MVAFSSRFSPLTIYIYIYIYIYSTLITTIFSFLLLKYSLCMLYIFVYKSNIKGLIFSQHSSVDQYKGNHILRLKSCVTSYRWRRNWKNTCIAMNQFLKPSVAPSLSKGHILSGKIQFSFSQNPRVLLMQG